MSAEPKISALRGGHITLADAEIGTALAELWGARAPATWNRNRAAVTSWLLWCRTKKHWAAPSVPADAERRKESADETRAVAKTAIHRLLSRRDILRSGRRRCGGCCTRRRPGPRRSWR